MFLSSEALAGWDARHWRRNVAANQSFFGTDATVLLLIRRPSAWLRSVYQQRCHHRGEWLYPHEFFRTADTYDPESLRVQFDLDAFDLAGLIAAYGQAFDRLVVQKYETIADGRFLRAALGAGDGLVADFQHALATTRSNRAFSDRAVKLGFRLAQAREKLLGRPRVLPPGAPHYRSRLDRLFRKAMQLVVDPLLPYRPHVFDWAEVPGCDIRGLDAAYDALPDFVLYQDRMPVDLFPDLPKRA